jgi:hypothetical protein
MAYYPSGATGTQEEDPTNAPFGNGTSRDTKLCPIPPNNCRSAQNLRKFFMTKMRLQIPSTLSNMGWLIAIGYKQNLNPKSHVIKLNYRL